MQAFYDMVLRGQPRPKYSWKVNGDSIDLDCADKPTEVKLWKAVNENARDFRLMTIKDAYKPTVLSASADGRYRVQLETPSKGYAAYFVEMTFPSGAKYPVKFTTGVKVLPDKYDYPAPNMRGAQ